MRVAPRVEQRRCDHRRPARLQRDLREQRRRRLERVGLRARGALRRARRTRGEDHDPPFLRRRGELRFRARRDQLLERGVGRARAGLAPRDEALAPLRTFGDQLGELLVIDHSGRVFAAQHVGDLRSGERRVQIQRAGAQLRAGDRRLDEATVVAAHDRHVLALADPHLAQLTGERVRAPVHLAVADRTAIVDDRRAIRKADRTAQERRRRGRAPLAQRAQRAQRLVRPFRLDHARPEQGPRDLQLVAGFAGVHGSQPYPNARKRKRRFSSRLRPVRPCPASARGPFARRR